MKNFIILLFSTTLLVNTLKAQVLEGHVVYTITTTTDNPDMQMVIGMMDGSKMEMYFSKDKTRSQMSMGALMNVTTISDNQTGDVVMLMDGMNGKSAIKSNTADMKADSDSSNFKITLVDESKKILGYNCKKAISTDSEGYESIYWYTNDLVIAKKGQAYLNASVPGFPLEFDIYNNGIKMTMIASTFEEKIDKSLVKNLFDMTIPADFPTITKEELLKTGGM